MTDQIPEEYEINMEVPVWQGSSLIVKMIGKAKKLDFDSLLEKAKVTMAQMIAAWRALHNVPVPSSLSPDSEKPKDECKYVL